MGGKQSRNNDISPTKLNSIHHKVVINTDRVERVDSMDYNTSCNCEMRWDGDGHGADVGDDVDDVGIRSRKQKNSALRKPNPRSDLGRCR